jgi:hypothetical protein
LHLCEAEQTYKNQERYVLSQCRLTPRPRRIIGKLFPCANLRLFGNLRT